MKIANVKSTMASIAGILFTFSACHAQKQVSETLELTPSCPPSKTAATEINSAGQGRSSVGRSALDAVVERIRPGVDANYASIIAEQQVALKTLQQQREQYRVQLNRSNLRVPRSGEEFSSATKTSANLLALISQTDRDLRKVELKIADLNKKRNLNLLDVAWRRLSQPQRTEILDTNCLSDSEKTELLKVLLLSNTEAPHMQDLVGGNPVGKE